MSILKHTSHDKPTYDEMVTYNNEFLEHLTDHLLIAFAFMALGILIGLMITLILHNKKFRIDYEMEKGKIMRIYPNNRKWFIVNPSTMMEWFDVFLLCIVDIGKSKDKVLDHHDKRRVRIVSVSIVLCMILFILTGVLMIFSASNIDMNPFNWLRGYRPWN